MPDLLLELFSEEIPARMQPKAADDLRRLVTDGLVERGLTYAHAAAFATPRRLTLALTGLTERSPDLREERKGPRADAPAQAIEGFLRSTGLTRDQLETRPDKKGDILVALIDQPGRPAAEIVAETVEEAVRAFPWPKSMRWGDGSLRWVRPLHAILCILTREQGAEIVPFAIDGIASGNTTRGHRFHAPDAFPVTSFEDYETKLRRAHVILDPQARADRIAHDAAQLAFAAGLELVDDPGLLAENAGLTEWPVTLLGRIEPRFLDLPPEVLQTSMRENQKFFSLRDPASGAITAYLVVANRETADDGATIIAGNARVLTARLADAEFFWQNDLRTPLADMAAKLAHVTFHGQTRHPRRTHRPHRRPRPRDRPRRRRRPRPRRARRAARQGRPRQPDGLRVPRAPGHHGPLLRREGRGAPRRRRRRRRALLPPRPHRRRPHRPPLGRRGPRRQARHPHRLLGHRREADRLQGPLRSSPRRARRDPAIAGQRSQSASG